MIVQKEFNGVRIDFDVFLREKNAMVNATQMGKIFGKLPKDFLKNDDTKNFILECLKKENSPFLGVKNEADLVDSKQKSGTWMHRVLALKFAAWLNPAFDLWVFLTIEELIFGSSIRRTESFKRTLMIEFEMQQIRSQENPTGDDFKRYLSLEDELKSEKASRQRETIGSIRELQLVLNFNNKEVN